MPRTAEAAKAFNQQLRTTAEAIGAPVDDAHAYGLAASAAAAEQA